MDDGVVFMLFNYDKACGFRFREKNGYFRILNFECLILDIELPASFSEPDFEPAMLANSTSNIQNSTLQEPRPPANRRRGVGASP